MIWRIFDYIPIYLMWMIEMNDSPWVFGAWNLITVSDLGILIGIMVYIGTILLTIIVLGITVHVTTDTACTLSAMI